MFFSSLKQKIEIKLLFLIKKKNIVNIQEWRKNERFMNEAFYTSNGAGSPFDVTTRSIICIIIFVCNQIYSPRKINLLVIILTRFSFLLFLQRTQFVCLYHFGTFLITLPYQKQINLVWRSTFFHQKATRILLFI